jgi:hypothetical protein
VQLIRCDGWPIALADHVTEGRQALRRAEAAAEDEVGAAVREPPVADLESRC